MTKFDDSPTPIPIESEIYEPQQMNKGNYILFTEGSYSDYTICSLAVTLKPFEIRQMRKTYDKEHPHNRLDHRDSNQHKIVSPFASWLETQGYIKEIDFYEEHDD